MPPLIYVRQDKELTRVQRRGRFSIPAACAKEPRHFAAAIKLAQDELIKQLAPEGFRFVDVAWALQGPLIHIQHFLSDNLDHGPMIKMPEITNLGHYDQQAMAAYERAERARTAWDAGEATDMEDYRVIGTFEIAVQPMYRAHVKERTR